MLARKFHPVNLINRDLLEKFENLPDLINLFFKVRKTMPYFETDFVIQIFCVILMV